MARVCFDDMSDDRVLERVGVLVRRSNESTAELLAYLAEIDDRKLYRREATSSLFAYCVERLHMSESAAAKRIWAARAARRFPLLLEMIARGEIHLAGVNLLAAHLTEANHAELLALARHKTSRDIEKLVAAIAPRPDVPSRVVALQQRAHEQLIDMLAPAALSQEPPLLTEQAPRGAAPRPSVVKPLAPRRYEIRVTVDEETHAKLVQLQDLLAATAGSDPAMIISRAIHSLHQKTLTRKAAITDGPRAGKATDIRSRPVPAAVKRAVWTRDAARCAFVDDKGRRCSATRFLEFHHLDNWARGADHRVERIELRCRAHNQYQAELDYGVELMRARRHGSRRLRENRRAGTAPPRAFPGECESSRDRPSGWSGPPQQWALAEPQKTEADVRAYACLRLACDSHCIAPCEQRAPSSPRCSSSSPPPGATMTPAIARS